MSRIKYGMPTLIELKSLWDNIILCKELNLDFIEINMNEPKYTNKNLLKYKEEIRKEDIFFTLHLNEFIDFTNFDKTIRKAFISSVLETIKIAKELGIKKLVLHLIPGIVFTLPTEVIHIYNAYEDEYLEHAVFFRNTCERAIGKSNIKICIENTPVTYFPFMKNCVKTLLKSEVFALTYDIGHDHLGKNKDTEFIYENKNKISHFHIHDADKSDHLGLGDGKLDIKEKLILAKEVKGTCVIEIKTVEALKNSIHYLNINSLK
ncbi:MAG: sugar phosphate isomerase/epimerase family protein [Lachnospirales bacterium]